MAMTGLGETGRLLVIIFSVVMTTAQSSSYCPTTPEPCLETTYITLESAKDITRSSSYFGISETFYADFAILEGWYRATTGAGGDMPTEPPGIGHCQTLYPIWFNETFPTIADGVVERNACLQTLDDDCNDELRICIQKCNQRNEVYNVYWLSRPSIANTRYCFGTRSQCTDDPGIEPCFEPVPEPVLNSSIRREPNGPICYYRNYFYCYIQHSNHSLFFDVIWYADGKRIKTFEDQPYTEDAFELSPEDLRNNNITKFGINIRCTVRSKTEPQRLADAGNFSEFYVGFEAETTHITLEEGGTTQDFKVRTTVPLECWDLCMRSTEILQCRLQLEIVRPVETGSGTCLTVTDDVVFETAVTTDSTPQECTITLEHNPFDSNPLELNIPIKAKLDGLYDGSKEFALQLITTEDPHTKTLWGQLPLPRVQISVTDKDPTLSGKRCAFLNDPHVYSFNGRLYEMQLEGVFLLYRQITGIPIEVQGFFKDRGGYSTSCGVAIRSYGELYVINDCGRTFHTKFYECDSVLNTGGSAVKNLEVSRSGNTYTIKLPTGGKVIFTTWPSYAPYGNIEIFPGLSDYKNTEGLCGYLKEDCANDLVTKTTRQTFTDNCACESRCGYWRPDTFYKSWRVNENLENSLFTGVISDGRTFKDTVFCGCEGQQATNDLKAVCSADGASSKRCVAQGNEETDKHKRFCGISRKKKAATKTDDLDDSFTYIPNNYDVNFVPPAAQWRNGWTEVKAQEYCKNYFNRRSITMCKDVAGVNVNASVSTCVADIHISGTTDHSNVGVDLIVSLCIEEIQKNVTLFTTNTTSSNGSSISIADQLLSALCPADCSDHGECVNGACQCEEDFIGLSCSENKHHIPTLEPIPFDALCDKNTRPCELSIVYGDLFIEGENLKCQVEVLNIDGTTRSEFLTQNAIFEHYQKVFCPLPTSQLPYILNVSVSNDKVSYSEDTQLLVYDSTCWNCSFASGCTKQKMSCIVTGSCYAEDMVNPTNSKEICQPSKQEYGWTNDDDHIPTIYEIPSSGLCDKFNGPCAQSPVNGDLFIASETLTCKLEVLHVNGTSMSLSALRNGIYKKPQEISCPLIEAPLPNIHLISVSNDKISYSGSQRLLVYNSVCWNCNLQNGCVKKKLSCVINGSCHAEDEQKPDSNTQICKPANNQYSWSDDPHHIPTIYEIPSSGLCDKSNGPCAQSPVNGDLFIASEALTCKLEVIHVNGTSMSLFALRNGIYKSPQEISCPLIEAPLPNIQLISVSNDKINYSGSQRLLVYEKVCWNCNLQNGCVRKKLSCIINGTCYAEDQQKPDNNTLRCKPASNQYSWSDCNEGVKEKCQGKVGWKKRICQRKEIDRCVKIYGCDPELEEPCGQNGQCVESNGAFKCQCSENFSGEKCQIDKPKCMADEEKRCVQSCERRNRGQVCKKKCSKKAQTYCE